MQIMSETEKISFAEAVQDAIVIAIMGMTGSGKSTFIQKATGTKEDIVGESLASFTEKPRLHEFSYDGKTIVLIDTPGFDDTFRTDADVLQDVAECLATTYEHNMKLTGIVYLHRIIDPRMTHGGMRNLAMFRKLCGTDPLKNVMLATSFWGEVDAKKGEQREYELETNPEYWKGMLAKGAQMTRFDNSATSALGIIRELASKRRVALDIQKEMCDQGLSLADTADGEALNAELAEIAKRHEKDMQTLREQMEVAKIAHDEELHDILEEQAVRNEKLITEMHHQQEILKADRRNEMRLMEQEFDRRLRRMELETQEEAENRLKAAVAKVRREQEEKTAATEAQQKRKENLNSAAKLRKEEEGKAAAAKKRKSGSKRVKAVKIGGAILATAATTAGCLINPMMAPSAISAFVKLANSFFGGDDSDGGDAGGDLSAGES